MIDRRCLMDISGDRKVLMWDEKFAYLAPCEQLRSVISNFTISFPDESIISDDYTIMPHGSATVVLLDYYSELYSFLFGPSTKPQEVGSVANKCGILFIIEFQPAGLFPFTKINQRELADRIVPFSQIDSVLDAAMRNILMSSASVDELLSEFEKKLIENIRFPYPKELTLALNSIIELEGVMTSAAVSDNIFYSSRHINRLFNQYLGMSMKAFSRLVRINKCIQLLNEKENNLDFICEKMGYYDVAHFVKDFKIICGATPQEYRTNMSDFYSEIAKY